MFVSSRCSGAFPPDGDMSSRLVSCSGSQLTAWAWQALLLPYTDCQEPSLSQPDGSTSLGKKGWERVTWKHSSLLREHALQVAYVFSA